MVSIKDIEMIYDDNGTKIEALKLKNLEIKDGFHFRIQYKTRLFLWRSLNLCFYNIHMI